MGHGNQPIHGIRKKIFLAFSVHRRDSLLKGNDRFRDQKALNEVFVNCMLAFIDFEITFCQHSGYEYSSDLMRAKTILQEYLARK